MSTRGTTGKRKAPPVVPQKLDFFAAKRAQSRKSLRDNSKPEVVVENLKHWQRRCARLSKHENGGEHATVFLELSTFLQECIQSYPRAQIAASEDDQYASSEMYERMRAEAEFLLNDYLPPLPTTNHDKINQP